MNDTIFRQKRLDSMLQKLNDGYYHRCYIDSSVHSQIVVFENNRVKHGINVAGLEKRDLFKRV